MSAVGVTQGAGAVVEFSEEQSGVSAFGGVLVEQLVDGTQEALRVIESDRALAAQVGLQVGHEEGGANSLPGRVADDQAETILAEVEKIVVVAADLVGLNATAGIFESVEARQGLRKQASLHALGDFQFLRGAALGFELLFGKAALGFDFADKVVAADEGKRVAVEIVEAGEDSAPERGLRRVMEANAALAPFLEFRHDVFGDQHGVAAAANQLVFLGFARGGDERKQRVAIGRGNRDPAVAGFVALVDDQAESELVDEKAEAAILVANEDVHAEKAEIGILTIEAKTRGQR